MNSTASINETGFFRSAYNTVTEPMSTYVFTPISSHVIQPALNGVSKAYATIDPSLNTVAGIGACVGLGLFVKGTIDYFLVDESDPDIEAKDEVSTKMIKIGGFTLLLCLLKRTSMD